MVDRPKCPFDGHEMGAATKIWLLWFCGNCDYHGRPLTVKECEGVGLSEAEIAHYGNRKYWTETLNAKPELVGKSEQELSVWFDELSKDYTGYGASDIVRARMKASQKR